ncbi:MAG: phage tail sheath subtilisin-like domain-containing protein [Verrucomicrobiales bacterium]|nr:phage tail sheath subtilisin-like domain-containing protein [Verrucomicrobiales bacterium]
MPIAPTYPGVYIEEVPSGVRTITGVATSITAFVGRAARGPVNEPTTINSFGDFERRFGGLSAESMMSYAVRDFFLNGGSQALIVRVVHDDAVTAQISLPTGGTSPNDALLLEAADPGAWGGNLQASVNHDTKDADEPAPDVSLFNLTITEDVEGGATEKYLNVSVDPDDPRYVPRVLEQSSLLVRVPTDSAGDWIVPNVRPLSTAVATSPPSSPPTEVDQPVPANSSPAASDGSPIDAGDIEGNAGDKTGLFALEKADLFNLLCIPPPTRDGDTDPTVYQAALKYCKDRRAMLIVDPPAAWGASPATAAANALAGLSGLGLGGTDARNAALYFPRVKQADPLRDRQVETFVPSGIIAGVMSRTDAQRGVWKAPAGLDATLNGIQGLQVNLTDAENGQLNPLGINCLRAFPVNGRVVWGARTMRGADQFADEYKYVPVRRTALFLEESLYRGTQWVVFEPNDEPLWAQIRLNVGAFMQNLFRQGAFQGKTPAEAYLVKCDKETTTQTDINLGIVNILVGFAPLKPAEFVIIKIQQLAGQIEV